ncbi:MAG: response regulator [Spirochaetales bacterium]|nr:response regulator [Spirochaetales bacterium]
MGVANAVYKVFLFLNISFIVAVCVVPGRIHTHLFFPYQIFLSIIGVWFISVLIRAVKNKRMGAGIILTGVCLILLAVCYDSFKYHFTAPIQYSSHFALVLFIFLQSIVLSFRYARAYRTAEHLSMNLQREVDLQTETISRQNRELMKLNDERTAFFINLAHETKTPLTLIDHYLGNYIKEKGMDQQLSVIKHNVEKLKNDMESFLDYEKLKRGQIFYNHNQVTSTTALLRLKIPLFEHIALKKDIGFTSDIEDGVYGKIDPQAFDRIINNVIENSIKYTENGGKIHITLTKKDDTILFIVKDTGIGIAEEQQKHVFEPYYQMSHEKGNIQGIGMGLNIVRRIIDEVKGTIIIDSKIKKGTTFTCMLKEYIPAPSDTIQDATEIVYPVYNDADLVHSNHTGKATAERTHDRNKHTLLIVEDNRDMMDFLLNHLQEQYNCYSAFHGLEALAELRIPEPDLIISDIMMDHMDGYAFFERVREKKKYRSVPFIFLTAKNTREEKIKALEKGAVDFISKPFSMDELQAKVKSIIEVQEELKKAVISKIEKKYHAIINQLRLRNDGMDGEIKKQVVHDFGISKREIEIIYYLKKGYAYKEIAYELDISINTVREYIKRIYTKCSVQNKIELIRLF